MADAVATQILVDGPRNVVMKLTNVSDGTGESAVKKVDVSELLNAPSEVRINRIHYSTVGMAVRLLWDATSDVEIFAIAADHSGCMDFTGFGGLKNDSGSGKTGDIMLTTVGHSSGDAYSIILEMSKS